MSKETVKAELIPSKLSNKLTSIRGTMNRSAAKFRDEEHAKTEEAYYLFIADAIELGIMYGCFSEAKLRRVIDNLL